MIREPLHMADLQLVLRELGKGGGLIGPSIYDTAQVLRYAPASDTWPAVAWLLDRQRVDGGWGDADAPRARDLPTLAAILALHTTAPARTAPAVAAGLAFLRTHAQIWDTTLPEDIPVGAELLLPALLEEAAAAGLWIDPTPYTTLIRLGQRRRQMIAGRRIPAGSTPIHSWEALGLQASRDVIDGSGGVGHSPAATAAWLFATRGRADLAAERAAAQRFLDRAAEATGTGVPGLVPTVWPITNFERVWVLYALQIAGLLDHPDLRRLIEAQLDLVERDLLDTGLGMSAWFVTDGDITATTLALLAGAGRQPSLRTLERFARPEGGYLTYIGELQRSISATAHAAHALALLGGDNAALLQLLRTQRADDGTWSGDKWHTSWLYLTSHIMVALCASDQVDVALESLPAIMRARRSDGAWGERGASLEDTAYALLALHALDRAGALPDAIRPLYEDSAAWGRAHYSGLIRECCPVWIGKELYRPHRVVQATILAALIGCALPIELAQVA